MPNQLFWLFFHRYITRLLRLTIPIAPNHRIILLQKDKRKTMQTIQMQKATFNAPTKLSMQKNYRMKTPLCSNRKSPSVASTNNKKFLGFLPMSISIITEKCLCNP